MTDDKKGNQRCPMEDLKIFRQETRDWLEANCPADMRQLMRSEDDQCWGGRNWVFTSENQKLWLERMAAKGWTAPRWPVEYGGGGLSVPEAKVLGEEMARIGARRPLSSFGLDMLGPALLLYATEEQKQEYIPDIVTAKFDGAKDIANPMQDPILPACAQKPRTWVITTSSMVRKSGPLTPTKPTGFSAWLELILIAQSMKASASCCLIWHQKESAPSQSS
jgi:hypothetical protein